MKSNGLRFLAFFALALGFVSFARAEGELWTSDYAAALAKAKAENKHVLLDFTGSDWCGWCIRLKKEVFSQKDFIDFASQHYVLVELDFPRKKKLPAETAKQNRELQDKFQIEGYPTVIILDADGREIGRTGYMEGGPAAFNAELKNISKL